MSFKPFIRDNSPAYEKPAGMYIRWKKTEKGYDNGDIYFSVKTRAELDIASFKSVETFRDDDNKLVALRFNNNEHSPTNALIRKNGNGRYMHSNSFVKLMVEEYGYPANATVLYNIIEGGLIVLLKDSGEDHERT